jgi:Calcineurin-like phosphoesterase
MTVIRLVGDAHGKFRRYSTILDNSPYSTIQVGDMGVGFRHTQGPREGEFQGGPPYDKMLEGGHRFIRGNHDNPAYAAKHTQYIPDGTVEGNVMFVGGALSIDRIYRIEGYSWWADEELSGHELAAIKHKYAHPVPEIMVTHECPESIAEMILRTMYPDNGQIKLDPRFASRTRVAFEDMFRSYQPKLWIFGHWHVPFDQIVNGTRFICLPELATVDVDIDKAEVIDTEPNPGFDRSILNPMDNDF